MPPGSTTMPSASAPLLSLCMILKDEEYFIRRCLDSVRDHVDDMVLVDTGSTDRTRELCRDYTDRVFDFTWVDDFAAARNHALARARGEWILVLDADEVILPRDLRFMRDFIGSAPEDVYSLRELNYSNDTTRYGWQLLEGPHPLGWDYRGYSPNRIARLFRNRPEIRYTGTVHEVIDPAVPGVRYASLDVDIHHDSSGNATRDPATRQLNYLRIIEGVLRQRADGRLAGYAGHVRMTYLQDYPAAIAHFRQAVAQGYEPRKNLACLAEAHYRQGDHGRALDIYAQLYAEGFAPPHLCNNYANLLVKRGDYAAAVTVLERALAAGGLAADWVARMRHNVAYLQRRLAAD